MLDLWTDVFASPGTRTTGAAQQTFALVGPHWKEGEQALPAGAIDGVWKPPAVSRVD